VVTLSSISNTTKIKKRKPTKQQHKKTNKQKTSLVPVAHACNPSYYRDQNCSSTSSQKKKKKKKGWWSGSSSKTPA
jgi:hypothetical protein